MHCCVLIIYGISSKIKEYLVLPTDVSGQHWMAGVGGKKTKKKEQDGREKKESTNWLKKL